MKGLASGNYDELGEAIRRERDIITEQKALVDDEQAKMPPQRSVSTRKRK